MVLIVAARFEMFAVAFLLCVLGGWGFHAANRSARGQPVEDDVNYKVERGPIFHVAMAGLCWTFALALSASAPSVSTSESAAWAAGACTAFLGLFFWPRKATAVASAIVAGLVVATLIAR